MRMDVARSSSPPLFAVQRTGSRQRTHKRNAFFSVSIDFSGVTPRTFLHEAPIGGMTAGDGAPPSTVTQGDFIRFAHFCFNASARLALQQTGTRIRIFVGHDVPMNPQFVPK